MEVKYQYEIQAMMYTSGDVRSPLPESTQLMEDIVKNQVIELAMQASSLAQRRGARNMSPEDLIFLIRKDNQKSHRLKEFLSWKDVRKNVKNSEETEALVEDEKLMTKPKRKKMKMPWELLSILADKLDSDSDGEEDDWQELELQQDSQIRLFEMDLITRNMNQEQYMDYSECRQASFTYKKTKKFRDFINLNAYIDMKPSDDIIEILGFLGCEMVQRLTEVALLVKHEESQTSNSLLNSFRNKPNQGLFGIATEVTPIKASHIREAYSRLQQQNSLQLFRGGLLQRRSQLI